MIHVRLIVERTHMKLIDDKLFSRCKMKVISLPVEAHIVNEGVAD